MLLVELRDALAQVGRRVGVGVARGDVLGPPLGNHTLHWRDWVRRGVIDQIVVDQSSSQCPSMWHQLWPMHRGTGYVQNYLEDGALPPLSLHLRDSYGPCVMGTSTSLYVARQWHPRCEQMERELYETPGVTGLVFSTFRHGNPRAIARDDWTAGRSNRATGLRVR